MSGKRLAFIDALKALASQLIVLHHLAFYGPMSDYAQPLVPALTSWLYDYARIAVQAFLVIGGFLAAQALARDGHLIDKPLVTLIWRRYLKLVLPYLGALLLAIAAAAIARQLMSNANTPELPTLPQLLAHVFLLHGILGFEGLSAGVWYVAIDFQLYVLLLIALWLARHTGAPTPTLGRIVIAALMLASLFYFNRHDALDNWGIYFFGAYGLGALTYWISGRPQQPTGGSPGMTLTLSGLLIAALLVALCVDFRLRIAVALAVALALGLARYTGLIGHWPKSKRIAWLGQISYAVFLVHYPTCLVINALFERFAAHTPEIQLAGMIIAWLSSIGVGALFYRHIECRAHALCANKASR